MAKVSYLLQSKSGNSEIYARLTLNRTTQFKRKTGLSINSKDWSTSSSLPKQNNPRNKNFTSKLKKLSVAILDYLNDDSSEGIRIDGDWLSHKIDLHFGRISDSKHSELIIDVIDLKIKYAATAKNGKGGIGLSPSRIKSYSAFKKIIENYQTYRKKVFKVSDVNIDFGNEFSSYLIHNKMYSEAYALKKVSDLKVICGYAESLGIKTNPLFKKISSPKPRNKNIIFLTTLELKQIQNTQITKPYLLNARKWLLLGCAIGQRGGDLLNITNENFITRKGMELIELTQQKTQTKISIPVTKKIKRIIKDGLPHPISIVKFNSYLKEVCCLSKIDTVIDNDNTPKWKKISSHSCRRSFASNEDDLGILDRRKIRYITGHASEASLAIYIGKKDLDIAEQILAAYKKTNYKKENAILKSKIKNLKNEIKLLKEKKHSKLSIVKKLAT